MRSFFICFSFVCACTSAPQTFGPVYDSGPDTLVEASIDAASDGAVVEASTDAASCTSTLALVGGTSSTLFGAGGPTTSALSATAITGSLADCGNDFGCANPVAIARLGSGLLAVLAAQSGALQSATYATSWSAPANVATASTIDGPALAVIGATAHLLFQGADYKYLHAQYTSSAWDSASDPVGGGGANQSYGARGPAAASAATDLIAVQGGANSYLYDQTWNGSWQAADEQGGAAVQNTLPPTMIALAGGASELLAAYLRNGDYKVMTVARTSGTWGTPMLVDPNAYSNDPVALAALPSGKALLVFRGSDKKPYFSTWDGASTWTTASAIASTSNPMIESVPSVTPGVCGADAIVAFAATGGGVEVATFTAGAFAPPTTVAGTAGAKFVAVATLP